MRERRALRAHGPQDATVADRVRVTVGRRLVDDLGQRTGTPDVEPEAVGHAHALEGVELFRGLDRVGDDPRAEVRRERGDRQRERTARAVGVDVARQPAGEADEVRGEIEHAVERAEARARLVDREPDADVAQRRDVVVERRGLGRPRMARELEHDPRGVVELDQFHGAIVGQRRARELDEQRDAVRDRGELGERGARGGELEVHAKAERVRLREAASGALVALPREAGQGQVAVEAAIGELGDRLEDRTQRPRCVDAAACLADEPRTRRELALATVQRLRARAQDGVREVGGHRHAPGQHGPGVVAGGAGVEEREDAGGERVGGARGGVVEEPDEPGVRLLGRDLAGELDAFAQIEQDVADGPVAQQRRDRLGVRLDGDGPQDDPVEGGHDRGRHRLRYGDRADRVRPDVAAQRRSACARQLRRRGHRATSISRW